MNGKVFFLILVLFADFLNAEKLFFTNSIDLPDSVIKSTVENKQVISKDKVSHAEVLYGKYENIDLQLLISREYENAGYLINYARFKIESFPTNDRKVFNSGYGSDNLNANLYFLLGQNFLLNLGLKYNTSLNGTMSNPFYNNESARVLVFNPSFKYFISDKSFISAVFSYNDSYVNFESADNEYYVGNTMFEANVEYSRVWSRINAFSLNLDTIQYSTELQNNRDVNSIAIVKAQDKFAVSKSLIFTFGLNANVNKKYSFVFEPIIDMLYLFNKTLNLNIFYNSLYIPEYYNNVILTDRFVQVLDFFKPYIKRNLGLGIGTAVNKDAYLTVESVFVKYKNYPSFIYGNNRLYYINPGDFDVINLQTVLRYEIDCCLNFILKYDYIPYVSDNSVYLIKNKLSLDFNFTFNMVELNFKIKYFDLMRYTTESGNSLFLDANIVADVDCAYKINNSFGFKLKVANIGKNTVCKLPFYPEYNDLIKLGIYTGF